jgi:dipeptidyl aminopeptidase/acylaminoacyl peptidase
VVRPLLSGAQYHGGLPPTMLIHGPADTDVPFDESVKMEGVLSHFKTKHDYLSVPEGSHCPWKRPTRSEGR